MHNNLPPSLIEVLDKLMQLDNALYQALEKAFPKYNDAKMVDKFPLWGNINNNIVYAKHHASRSNILKCKTALEAITNDIDNFADVFAMSSSSQAEIKKIINIIDNIKTLAYAGINLAQSVNCKSRLTMCHY